jgi:hypothetical protein
MPISLSEIREITDSLDSADLRILARTIEAIAEQRFEEEAEKELTF